MRFSVLVCAAISLAASVVATDHRHMLFTAKTPKLTCKHWEQGCVRAVSEDTGNKSPKISQVCQVPGDSNGIVEAFCLGSDGKDYTKIVGGRLGASLSPTKTVQITKEGLTVKKFCKSFATDCQNACWDAFPDPSQVADLQNKCHATKDKGILKATCVCTWDGDVEDLAPSVVTQDGGKIIKAIKHTQATRLA